MTDDPDDRHSRVDRPAAAARDWYEQIQREGGKPSKSATKAAQAAEEALAAAG